jgi:hypothetical protein
MRVKTQAWYVYKRSYSLGARRGNRGAEAQRQPPRIYGQSCRSGSNDAEINKLFPFKIAENPWAVNNCPYKAMQGHRQAALFL